MEQNNDQPAVKASQKAVDELTPMAVARSDLSAKGVVAEFMSLLIVGNHLSGVVREIGYVKPSELTFENVRAWSNTNPEEFGLFKDAAYSAVEDSNHELEKANADLKEQLVACMDECAEKLKAKDDEVASLKVDRKEIQETLSLVETEVAFVYDHLTRGRFCKWNTRRDVIIAEVEQLQSEHEKETIDEATEEIKVQLASVLYTMAKLLGVLRAYYKRTPTNVAKELIAEAEAQIELKQSLVASELAELKGGV